MIKYLSALSLLLTACNGYGSRIEPCNNTAYLDLDGTFLASVYVTSTTEYTDGTSDTIEETGNLHIYSDQCGDALIFFSSHFTAVGNIQQFGAPLHFDITGTNFFGYPFHSHAEGYLEKSSGWLEFTIEYEHATRQDHWTFSRLEEITP